MEAKDTVIKVSPSLRGTTTDLLEEQAEISFGAGIREVMQELNLSSKEIIDSSGRWLCWNYNQFQAKLKEWGVHNVTHL